MSIREQASKRVAALNAGNKKKIYAPVGAKPVAQSDKTLAERRKIEKSELGFKRGK